MAEKEYCEARTEWAEDNSHGEQTTVENCHWGLTCRHSAGKFHLFDG